MKKMAVKEKRAWLEAIRKLEKFYRAVIAGKKPSLFSCPLCEERNIYQLNWQRESECYCPWYWYEKRYCGDALFLRYDRDIPWAKTSLRRLARWKKLLEGK